MFYIISFITNVVFASNLLYLDDKDTIINDLLSNKKIVFKYVKNQDNEICVYNDPFSSSDMCFGEKVMSCLFRSETFYGYKCEGLIYKNQENEKIGYNKDILDDYVANIELANGGSSMVLAIGTNCNNPYDYQKFIAKINSNDGSLDKSFNVVPCTYDSDVNNIEVDPTSNSIYVGGLVNILEDEICQNFSFIKLKEDGKIDKDFKFPLDDKSTVEDFVMLDNGDIILVGDIITQNIKNYIIKIDKNGNLLSFNNNRLGTDKSPEEIYLSNDHNQLLIRGEFTRYNNLYVDGFVVVDIEGVPFDIGYTKIDNEISLKNKKEELKKLKIKEEKESNSHNYNTSETRKAFKDYSKIEVSKEKIFIKEDEIQNIEKNINDLKAIASDPSKTEKEKINALKSIKKLKAKQNRKNKKLEKLRINQHKKAIELDNNIIRYDEDDFIIQSNSENEKQYHKYWIKRERIQHKDDVKQFYKDDGKIDYKEQLKINKLRKNKRKNIQEEKILMIEADMQRIQKEMLGLQSIYLNPKLSSTERNKAQRKYLESQSKIKAKNDMLKSLKARQEKFLEKGNVEGWFE